MRNTLCVAMYACVIASYQVGICACVRAYVCVPIDIVNKTGMYHM